jgi:hypothetical protein
MRTLSCGLFVIGLFSVVGCEAPVRQNPATIRGKVTYKGQLVKAGLILFSTAEGAAYQVPIQATGIYEISDVPVGPVTITIDTESGNPDAKIPNYSTQSKQRADSAEKEVSSRMKASGQEVPARPAAATKGMAERYVKIPEKYSKVKDTPLKMDVVKGQNTKDFDLVD